MSNVSNPRRRSLRWLGALAAPGVAATWPVPGLAVVYLQRDEALKLLAPVGASTEPVELALDADALRRIAEASGTRVPRGYSPVCYAARAGGAGAGWVCFDQVLGKYELIDYAVGFDPAGTVTGVEILVYRESHGSAVRNSAWRGQFIGRNGPGAMRFGDDIRNVTGATLSCQHVTDGVRRLAATLKLAIVARENR